MAIRASAMSCSRSFGLRSRQRAGAAAYRAVCGWKRCPVDLLSQDRGEHFRRVFSSERPRAGEHLVEHQAERPDVRALVDELTFCLLGRHIGSGAEDDAHLRQCRRREGRREGGVRCGGRGGRGSLGEAEIEDLDGAVGAELDVRRFQIAMDDAGLVRRFERFGHLFRDRQRLVDGDGAARDALREILALDELHHEGADAGRFFDAVQLRDVRMIERGQRLRFAFEPHETIGVRREGLPAGSSARRRDRGAYRGRDTPRPCRRRRADRDFVQAPGAGLATSSFRDGWIIQGRVGSDV